MRISDWSSDVCSSDLLADQDARLAGLDIEHDKEADAANKRQVVQLSMELDASKQDLCAMRTQLDAMRQQYDSARERLTDLENALENAHQFYQRDTGDLAKQRDIALAQRDQLQHEFDTLIESHSWRSEEHTSELQSLMRN